MKKRSLLLTIVIFFMIGIWFYIHDKRDTLVDISSSFMPHEGEKHTRTWVNFTTDETKHNRILIISSIAQYEPVSVLVEKEEKKELLTMIGKLNTHHYPIEVLEVKQNTSWLRDTAPTFVLTEEKDKGAINFSPIKEAHAEESNISTFVATQADAKIIQSNIRLKGNCVDVDGAGTALLTESCIINDLLNPYWDKSQIEIELKLLLGLQKIIWLKGKEEENLDTHLYARFAKPGMVLVHRNNDKSSDEYVHSRENIQTLQNTTDATGKKLEVIIVDAPKHGNKNYLGYYLCNRALIMQNFGDEKADYTAKKILQHTFPNRSIEEVYIDAISSTGGDIHRVTQQEPKIYLPKER